MRQLLGLPIDASQHGPEIDNLIVIVHWLMLALFVGWGCYFLYALLRFRRARNPVANYHGTTTKFSTYVEAAVAVIEVILIVGFAIPLWSQRVDKFPEENSATVIRVVGEQFAWNAHYAGPDGVFGRTDINLISAENPLGIDREDQNGKDDVATVNNLNFPVNKPVIIYLTSKDVIHSLSLPLFRVKQDAIPGERIPIWFMPTKTTKEIQDAMVTDMSTAELVKSTNLIVNDDYKDKSDSTVAKKGDTLSDEVMSVLRNAGIQKIRVTQDVPTEIGCAQLCGLGHYKMKGSIKSMTQEEFDKWIASEVAFLQPPQQ